MHPIRNVLRRLLTLPLLLAVLLVCCQTMRAACDVRCSLPMSVGSMASMQQGAAMASGGPAACHGMKAGTGNHRGWEARSASTCGHPEMAAVAPEPRPVALRQVAVQTPPLVLLRVSVLRMLTDNTARRPPPGRRPLDPRLRSVLPLRL